MSTLLKYCHFSRKTSIIFLLYFLFLFLIEPISCDDKKERNVMDIFILVMIIIGVVILVVIGIVIYIKCIKPKLKARKKNKYFEETKILENEDQEELSLRENILKYGKTFLPKYICQKLIVQIYTESFELFGNRCNICLEYFSFGQSQIVFGGCFHIFHKSCIEEFSQKINTKKKLIPQFICSVCRSHLFFNIDKIKNYIQNNPDILEEIHKNKKISNINQIQQYFNEVLNLDKECEYNINLNNDDIRNGNNINNDNNIYNENDKNNENNIDCYVNKGEMKSEQEKIKIDRDIKYNNINDIDISIDENKPKELKTSGTVY